MRRSARALPVAPLAKGPHHTVKEPVVADGYMFHYRSEAFAKTINEQTLAQMAVPADLARRYLDHAAFTPRHDLMLVDALHRLGAAAGRERYLTTALVAEDEVEANFFVNTAQILRGVHETRDRITAITMFDVLTVAQTRSGVAIIPFALEHGVWTANADRLSQHLKTAYRAPGFNGRFELQARGFSVVEQAGSRFEIVD